MRDPAQVELLLLGSQATYDAARLGRDRLTQAVLGIDPSFTFNEELFDTLDDDQCKAIVSALGVGIMFPDDPSSSSDGAPTFDISRLRYGRIILVTENDEVLRFFSRYMHPLVIGGHVLVPEAPLRPGFTEGEFVESILRPETRRLRVAVGRDG